MKIAKFLLILLVPALAIVSCQKSTIKPGCSGAEHETSGNEQTVSSKSSRINAEADTQTSPKQVNREAARTVKANEESLGENGDGDPTDIIGSGDDDREGGKKNKIGTR